MNDYVLKLIAKAHAEKATFLDLGMCGLTAIPEEILQCASHLKEINFGVWYDKDGESILSSNDFSNNDFSTNPTSLTILSGLPELHSLHLYRCEIGDKGAESISALKKLTTLDIHSNNIGEKGAESIKTLFRLTNLNIDVNNIGEKGAESISALSQLTNLNIGANKIGEKGAKSISTLKQLTTLDISWNNIGEKGAESIKTLFRLTNLNIDVNNIGEKGAESISALSQLTNLNIGDNLIGDNGAESISSLSQLTNLNISWNYISEKGAESISTLSQLTVLNIECNQIGNQGAVSISSLSHLTDLSIRWNDIGDKGAENLSVLPLLTNLNIGRNNIGDKGAESISVLPLLTNLNITRNNIGDKGAESISSLSQLTTLEIGYNIIKHICCFRNIESLRYLDVRNNPIRDVPESIYNQENCIDNLRIWWNETSDNEKVKPNKTVKLQVLGNGNAGKSSIIEALKNEVCKTKFESTHGIVIEPLNFSIDNEDINFNVWDFGGQEIYHGTHKLFIASQSIHLLVGDDESEQLALDRTRVKDREKPDEMVLHQPLQHYIDSSKRQSPGSIRIIVKNKIDIGDSISDNNLKTIADKNKIDYLAVSATQGTGIIELRKLLSHKREDILHYGMLMPVSWLDVQNFFLSNLKRKEMYRQKMINLDIFNEICVNCQVSDISRPALLDFLHHTGIIYENEEFSLASIKFC